MDLSADTGTPTPHATVGGPAPEQELPLSGACGETESGVTLLLQLLEFKTHLLEAVEELHIRKDAETRFEDQISKLVLEKQELEWEKESLQRQIETAANQHAESLAGVKKQFQAKIRNIEEEKGKYQVSAELKDKEINNLKEELRSLQLLKYNLEKKSNELEQKLALQSRSKDSHLNQLGEVEKRFTALSRQCSTLRQAHEKLEQNVDEAMRINKKLTSANEKQDATIVSLKKELEEVNNKLITAKMTSVRHKKTHSPTGQEQHIQKLHQKLNMETEMNKKLREENESVRAEKQEVMRSLQHTQQLLLTQTHIVNRAELELQTQREQHQALKREHEVMRDKSKAMEDKVARLMESSAASETSWDKEKTVFLNRIEKEQQDLQAAKEAYDELHQKHAELSAKAKAQAQHIFELEMRNSSQGLSVSTQASPPKEPIPSSELSGFGSPQRSAPPQTENPDCLEDAGAVTKLVATGTTGGPETQNLHRELFNASDLFTCPLINNHLVSLCSQDGRTDDDTNILNKHRDLIYTTSPDHRSVGLLSKDENEERNRGTFEKKHGGKGDDGQEKNRKEEERNTERQRNGEEARGEEAKEGGNSGDERGTLAARTADTADRRGDSQGSAGDTRNLETETRDRAGRRGTDGAEERGKAAARASEAPDTQIPGQTRKSSTRQVADSAESPLAVCDPSHCSQSPSQKVTEKDVDDVNKGCECAREGQSPHTLSSDDSPNASRGPDPVTQAQNLRLDRVQAWPPSRIHQASEKTTEETPADNSAADFPTELSEPLSQSSVCSSQTNAPLAARADVTVIIQDLETTTTQTVSGNPCDVTNNMERADEMCDVCASECVSAGTQPQSQEITEGQNRQLKSLLTNDDDDSRAHRKSKVQTNVDARENCNGETVQAPAEKFHLKDVRVDTAMDAVDLGSEVGPGSCQQHLKNDKTRNKRAAKTTETDLKPPIRPTGPRSSLDSVSALRRFVQVSEKNARGAAGRLRHPPGTLPTFPKRQQSKAPAATSRASDLPDTSGSAASSPRRQLGERRVGYGSCYEESRASPTVGSFPASSGAVSRLWLTTPGCSRAPTSAAAPLSESDWELSCSQEREDQQSSLRAQISKIEQFLNTERLSLPKRRRTEN